MNRILIGYRKMLGINQSELANKIGMTSSNYSKRESGSREFRASEMFKIMEVINLKFPLMTMEDIFTTV